MARFKVGDVVETNECGRIEILEKGSERYYVVFLDTGFKRWVRASAMYYGKIHDPFKKTVAGVGYVGDGLYVPKIHTKVYSKWCQMLQRCYNEEHAGYETYGARGVVVCDEWHCFQNYAAWHSENYIDGYELDKDLLSPETRVYSPETCCFVPREINRVIVGKVSRKAGLMENLPTGVVLSPSGYKAKIGNSLTKTVERSEFFDNPEDAFLAYKKRKLEVVKELAELYYGQGLISKRVRNALLEWEPK